NTLRSDRDRLKLDELMALCTTFQKRVLDLEKTKTTQQNEIDSLKGGLRSLIRKIVWVKMHQKRGGLMLLMQMKNVDEEMFDVNVLDGEEVFVAKQEVDVKDVSNVVSTAGDATTVSAATTTIATITTIDDITLAQALMEIKRNKIA
ncbi:hypothetical protein Tco_0253902, partial [Tanacetum coccineum]